jgi:hypothetical protein
MARPLRVECHSAYYHVINRGNNQEEKYRNDWEREKFSDESKRYRSLKHRISKIRKQIFNI